MAQKDRFYAETETENIYTQTSFLRHAIEFYTKDITSICQDRLGTNVYV